MIPESDGMDYALRPQSSNQPSHSLSSRTFSGTNDLQEFEGIPRVNVSKNKNIRKS